MNDIANAESSKRRRACDACRRSKIRCDIPTSEGTRCAHCARLRLNCTFLEESKQRAPSKGYVRCLENRCKSLELLIKRISLDMDIDAEVGPSFTKDTWSIVEDMKSHPSASGSTSTPVSRQGSDPPNASLPAYSNITVYPALVPHLDPNSGGGIEIKLGELSLDKDVGRRFHGNSSGLDLIHVALNLKDDALKKGAARAPMKLVHSRAKYWLPPVWKSTIISKAPMPSVDWPPSDLLTHLIEIYFERSAFLLPIIHRPSFERDFKADLHKSDVKFARLVLVVISIGSRSSDDPRVCVPAVEGEIDWASAGWKYFVQLPLLSDTDSTSLYALRRLTAVLSLVDAVFGPSSLSSLQALTLSAVYLQYSGAPHVSWSISGIGVRFALDIGLHREKVYTSDHPFENQIWKRTFWALIVLDIMTSARLGRPCAVSLDEIDAELPLDVDDEHYDEATKQWNQPADKPCKITGFIRFIKLQRIVVQALRTVFSVKDPSITAVAHLDTALNSWLEDLPPHLQWDLATQYPRYQQDAAIIRLFFVSTRITIHRRFLPFMKGSAAPSPTSDAALAICTAAAQNTIQVIQVSKRFGESTFPFSGFAFGAATILLLNIWDTQRKGGSQESIAQHMADVRGCMDMLRASEQRSLASGRLLDILTKLVSMSEVPSDADSRAPTQKRTREGSEGIEATRIPPSLRHIDDLPSASDTSNMGSAHSMPSFSLIPGVPDISAIQWDFGSSVSGEPSMGSHPFTTLDVPGFGGTYMDSSLINGSFQGVALPENAFRDMFGNMSDIYGNAPPPLDMPFANESHIDWATELEALGLNPQPGGPSQS